MRRIVVASAAALSLALSAHSKDGKSWDEDQMAIFALVQMDATCQAHGLVFTPEIMVRANQAVKHMTDQIGLSKARRDKLWVQAKGTIAAIDDPKKVDMAPVCAEAMTQTKRAWPEAFSDEPSPF